MAEKTTVAFRIDESVKSDWEDAAENPEYNSLSHLIRLAVQREIAETESAPRTAQADTNTEDNAEVLESLNRLEKVTENIQEEVEAVAREEEAERNYDLEQVLLELLPTTPGDYAPGGRDYPDPQEVGQTPRDIAGRIGADTSDVEDVLENLEGRVGQVRQSVGYYWRVES
jgi:antitoxin component of RelBE/YafQ-DinJ toxin-antitoxin module